MGEEKPNINIFFNPIVKELKRIELGIKIEIEKIQRDTKFFFIAAVFDKPAKSPFINMISSNGFFGCHKCLQPGSSFKVKEDCNYF